MNLKMVEYYNDVLKYAKEKKHRQYLKIMRDYYLGLKSRPVIKDGTITQKYLRSIS